MLWLKAFHIIAMVTWFAGLFYLPRLFVYHAETNDVVSIERFKVMERRLYYGITWPGGLVTTFLGLWLLWSYMPYAMRMPWLHAKLALVLLLWGYHLVCGAFLKRFRYDKNCRTSRFYRIYNEFPTILLIAIVILVVVKP